MREGGDDIAKRRAVAKHRPEVGNDLERRLVVYRARRHHGRQQNEDQDGGRQIGDRGQGKGPLPTEGCRDFRRDDQGKR